MATVQIRNVPDDVHRVYRTRAARAGMSLQEYLLAQLTELARLQTPAEVMAEVEEQMRREGPEGWSRGSFVTEIREDRDSR
jgi:antitoxin FitA